MTAATNETTTISTGKAPVRGGDIISEQGSAIFSERGGGFVGIYTLIALRPGMLRFSELRRRVNGVSERMLAQSLQQLERDGLVLRKSYPVVPPHVEYSLTDLGQEAAAIVETLAEWVEGHMPDLMKADEPSRL